MHGLRHGLVLAQLLVGIGLTPTPGGAQAGGREEAEHIVVMVRARFDTEEQLGAGLVIGTRAGRTYIATANHVVRRGGTVASDVSVTLRGLPGESQAARVLDHADRRLDLAVLAVVGQPGQGLHGGPLPFAILGSLEAPKVGDDLYVLGNPLGNPWHVNLSPFKYRKADGDRFTFEAPLVQKGHSGGGVFDKSWQLIGMLVSDEPPDGVAVPMNRVVAQLKDWGYPVDLTTRKTQSAASVGASSQPPSVPLSWTGSRSYLVDEQYPCSRGSRCFFMVRLINVETDTEQKWLRFNFVIETIGRVEAYLDNTGQTAFLLDERGRQHPLALATGLSAEKPLAISAGGSARFALIFPRIGEFESFRYEATLYYRYGTGRSQTERVRIVRDTPISLADFR